MSPEVATVFWLVVIARFVLPLFIPVFPLPAIIACLVLDAADQTIFQSFGFDPPGYQGYDKAMDNFYLAMAFLSTLRNWSSRPAVQVSRFLFFYRLTGAVLFELTGIRALLLIFPNTFEYFFIAYETVRTRWNPLRLGMRGWVIVAAVIWVFVKLPQEWWIHVAQLDFTDTVRNVPWFGPAVVIALLVAMGVFWFVIRPRLPAPDWGWRIKADPLPAEMDSAAERDEWFREHGKVWSADTLEKVFLVGLLGLMYAQVLPGLGSTNGQIFAGLALIVLVSTAISLWVARRARSHESLVVSFLLRCVTNFVVLVAAILIPVIPSAHRHDVNWTAVVFFVVLLSLLTTLHDRFRPVHDARVS